MMNKTLFLFFFSLLALTACLHDEPRSSLNEQQTYDNAANLYVNTVATLYAHIGGSNDGEGLQGTYKGVYDYNTFCTDEAVIPIRGGAGTTAVFGRISTCTAGHPMTPSCKRSGITSIGW